MCLRCDAVDCCLINRLHSNSHRQNISNCFCVCLFVFVSEYLVAMRCASFVVIISPRCIDVCWRTKRYVLIRYLPGLYVWFDIVYSARNGRSRGLRQRICSDVEALSGIWMQQHRYGRIVRGQHWLEQHCDQGRQCDGGGRGRGVQRCSGCIPGRGLAGIDDVNAPAEIAVCEALEQKCVFYMSYWIFNMKEMGKTTFLNIP